MINYYYLVTDFKTPLFVGIVGYIKIQKNFLKNAWLQLWH